MQDFAGGVGAGSTDDVWSGLSSRSVGKPMLLLKLFLPDGILVAAQNMV
jgi:hypothetical protein